MSQEQKISDQIDAGMNEREEMSKRIQTLEIKNTKERRDLLWSYSHWLNLEYDLGVRLDSNDVDKFIKKILD